MRRVFVNPAGQRDNLGDSVLRRPYLDALRVSGSLHVLVGNDADFASGLGLQTADRLYTSKARWLVNAVWGLAIGKAAFAVNAGEVVGERNEYRRAIWQVVLARVARLRRSPVIVAGVSVRPRTDWRATRLGSLTNHAAVVAWRDYPSRDDLQVGEVAPDWAFETGRDFHVESEGRDTIAVSMRGDRPLPAPQWFEDVMALARESGARLVVVVQVRRDEERAKELATRLGAQLLLWEREDDHAAQELIVRDLYARSQFVVSDRIHALILGYTEGAVPAGTDTSGSDKIRRTFEPVTSTPVAPAGDVQPLPRWKQLGASRQELASDLKLARRKVQEVGTLISAALRN